MATEIDKQVEEFLTSIESMKVEFGVFKSFKDDIENKQTEIEKKIGEDQKAITERIDGLLVKFAELIQKSGTLNLKEIPDRSTQIIAEETFTKEDALDIGMRAIVLATLNPQIKEIHLMPDLHKRFKPKPDPEAWGYNLAIARRFE